MTFANSPGAMHLFELVPSNSTAALQEDDDSAVNPRWGLIFLLYFAYILGLILLCLLLDKCQAADSMIDRLTLASQSQLLPHLLRRKGVEANEQSLEAATTLEAEECCDCLCGNKVSDEMKAYKVEYLNHLIHRPAFAATSEEPFQLTAQSGTRVDLLCAQLDFSPGVLSDWKYYLCNNHSFFGMFASTKGHPFTRAEKRSAFFCLNCVAMSFSVFVTAMQLSSSGRLLFNIFVVSPVMVLLNKQLYYLLACPCTMDMRARGGCAGCCASFANSIGWMVLLPIASACLFFLFAAALFNRGDVPNAGVRIATYAYSVHIFSAAQEVLFSFRSFLTGRFFVKVYFLNCVPVWTGGAYFKEKMEYGMVEGVHYEKIPRQTMFLGLIGYEGFKEISSSGSADNRIVPAKGSAVEMT